MNTPTLYTLGYLASTAERTMTELISTRTPIVDIRFSPTSRRWQYEQAVLSQREGILYTWVKELGNELYQQALTGRYTEPHVRLHDPDAGLAKLQAILQVHGKAVLLCACASATTCHRRVVAELAGERLGVSVVHLGRKPAQADAMPALLWDETMLLREGLHPDQQAIERESFERMWRLLG